MTIKMFYAIFLLRILQKAEITDVILTELMWPAGSTGSIVIFPLRMPNSSP